MESEFDLDRPIPTDPAVRLPPSKPRGGARILSFVLQAIVMAVALSLFFLFAGVAALLLLHLFVAGRALRRRRRRILNHSPNPNPIPIPNPNSFGLSPRDLKAMPSFGFCSSAAMTSSTDCSVCLEGFRDGDRCRNLPPCGHSFHRDCVDRWLMRSPACPICRRGVTTPVCV